MTGSSKLNERHFTAQVGIEPSSRSASSSLGFSRLKRPLKIVLGIGIRVFCLVALAAVSLFLQERPLSYSISASISDSSTLLSKDISISSRCSTRSSVLSSTAPETVSSASPLLTRIWDSVGSRPKKAVIAASMIAIICIGVTIASVLLLYQSRASVSTGPPDSLDPKGPPGQSTGAPSLPAGRPNLGVVIGGTVVGVAAIAIIIVLIKFKPWAKCGQNEGAPDRNTVVDPPQPQSFLIPARRFSTTHLQRSAGLEPAPVPNVQRMIEIPPREPDTGQPIPLVKVTVLPVVNPPTIPTPLNQGESIVHAAENLLDTEIPALPCPSSTASMREDDTNSAAGSADNVELLYTGSGTIIKGRGWKFALEKSVMTPDEEILKGRNASKYAYRSMIQGWPYPNEDTWSDLEKMKTLTLVTVPGVYNGMCVKLASALPDIPIRLRRGISGKVTELTAKSIGHLLQSLYQESSVLIDEETGALALSLDRDNCYICINRCDMLFVTDLSFYRRLYKALLYITREDGSFYMIEDLTM